MNEWIDFRNYTKKHYATFAIVLFLLLSIVIWRVSTQQKQAYEDYQVRLEGKILYTYAEDLKRPLKEEYNTVEEMVEAIVKEQLGVGSTLTTYKEVGVRQNLGLFVESAIYENNEIPTLPSVSKEELETLERPNNDQHIQDRFNEIMRKKEEALVTQRAEQEDEETALLRALQERLKEQD